MFAKGISGELQKDEGSNLIVKIVSLFQSKFLVCNRLFKQ
jgi:hypothetical protein